MLPNTFKIAHNILISNNLNSFGYWFFVSVILITTISCDPSEITDTLVSEHSWEMKNVEVVNGELHFTNFETFKKSLHVIMKMDEEELDRWEESLGFKSYRTWFNQSADEFFELGTEEEYQKWLNKYSDILYVKDSVVHPILDHDIYKNIVNRKGELMIGDNYTKVLSDRVITIENGNKDFLPDVMSMDESNTESGVNVLFFPNIERKQIQSRSSEICEYNFMESKIKVGKRKAIMSANYVVTYVGGPFYIATIVFRAHGHKKGLFGGWNNYKTEIFVENVKIGAENFFGQTISLFGPTGFSKTKEAREIKETVEIHNTPVYLEEYPTYRFLYGSGRVKTRGTGDQWTSFNCY